MLSQEQLFQTNEYWLEIIQNEIFRELSAYMKAKNLNQTQLAKEFGVSKGYISQILNGNFNFSLSKLIELALKIKKVPEIHFKSIDEYILEKEKEKQLTPKTISFSVESTYSFFSFERISKKTDEKKVA